MLGLQPGGSLELMKEGGVLGLLAFIDSREVQVKLLLSLLLEGFLLLAPRLRGSLAREASSSSVSVKFAVCTIVYVIVTANVHGKVVVGQSRRWCLVRSKS